MRRNEIEECYTLYTISLFNNRYPIHPDGYSFAPCVVRNWIQSPVSVEWRGAPLNTNDEVRMH
jgi:hypothetical protein